MQRLVLKDYLNTVLFGIVSYLVMDLHSDFKSTMKDVEDLRVMVGKHDYILNIMNRSSDKKNTFNFVGAEAILPDNNIEKKSNRYRQS